MQCRAAEATYRSELRAKHKAGRPPLGARISATEARRLIRRLKAEGFTKAQIIREGCGQRSRNLLSYDRPAVTLRRTLQLRRLVRLKLVEGAAHTESNGQEA